MYGSVNAAFRYGITAPFRRPPRDPPLPRVGQQRQVQQIEDRHHAGGGDAPRPALRHRANEGRLDRNEVHHRRPNRPMEQQAKVAVETLRTAAPTSSEDETDARVLEEERNLSAESDSETQQETPEEPTGASAGTGSANKTEADTKPKESESSKKKPLKRSKKLSDDESSRDGAASQPQPNERRPSQTDVQVSFMKLKIYIKLVLLISDHTHFPNVTKAFKALCLSCFNASALHMH